MLVLSSLKNIGMFFPRLSRLTMDKTPILPEQMKELESFKNLRQLSLRSCKLPDKTLYLVAEKAPKLTQLGIDDNKEVSEILRIANAGMIFNYNEDGKIFFDKAESFKTDFNIIRIFDRKVIAEKLGEILLKQTEK